MRDILPIEPPSGLVHRQYRLFCGDYTARGSFEAEHAKPVTSTREGEDIIPVLLIHVRGQLHSWSLSG